MYRLISTILLTLFCGSVSASNPQEAVVVDRVVAMVDNNVVTASDARLHAVLAELDPSFVPILQGRTGKAIDDVINIAVLRSVAGSVPVYLPKPHQVRERISQFRARWHDNQALSDFLIEHGLEGERLPSTLRRRMIVERVVHRNFGQPEADIEAWSMRFEEWMDQQRKSRRIRLVPNQANP